MGGGGAGTILDMIQRMRSNDSLARKHRYYSTGGHDIKTHIKIKHKEASPEQLQQVRTKMKRLRTKSTVISVISLLISVIVTAGLYYYFFGY